MVGGNHTYRVHQPCVVAQAENLFPCIRDPKFAIGLDQRRAGEEEGAHAVVDDVCLQHGASFAEEG